VVVLSTTGPAVTDVSLGKSTLMPFLRVARAVLLMDFTTEVIVDIRVKHVIAVN